MLVKYFYTLNLSPDKTLASHYASFPENTASDFIETSLSELCSNTDSTFISYEVVTDNLIIF